MPGAAARAYATDGSTHAMHVLHKERSQLSREVSLFCRASSKESDAGPGGSMRRSMHRSHVATATSSLSCLAGQGFEPLARSPAGDGCGQSAAARPGKKREELVPGGRRAAAAVAAAGVGAAAYRTPSRAVRDPSSLSIAEEEEDYPDGRPPAV